MIYSEYNILWRYLFQKWPSYTFNKLFFSNLFEVLIKFHGSPHISSANLLTCVGVLTNIAKTRAEFMFRVINAIESLFNNLPPTLTTTQVSSVKKKLKTELSGLLKHPAAYEYMNKITTMLSELGKWYIFYNLPNILLKIILIVIKKYVAFLP